MEIYEGTKVCMGECKDEKPITDFGWRVKDSSRRAVCKICYNIASRKRYKPNMRKDRSKVIKPKVEKGLYNSLVSIQW